MTEVERFTQALAEPGRASDDDGLGAVLAAALDGAAAAYPELPLDRGALAAALGERLPATPAQPSEALGALAVADLHLALACAAGSPLALARLEAGPLGVVELAARGLRAPDFVIDEARQIVRTLVLVPRDDAPPAIAQYGGRGDLAGWLRVVATRELIRLLKRKRPEVTLEEVILDGGPVLDPALEAAKASYRVELAQALREAAAALDPRDRLLLRQALIDGLTVDRIGLLFGVHRATAARWVARARSELAREAKQRLAVRLGMTADAIDSVVRLVQSRLDVSLEKHLAIE